MADFVQDGVYKSGLLIGDNFMQDIYACPYIDELLSTLRSQSDLEKFIRQKDEKRRADFISFDVSISANRENIKNCEKQILETEQKLKLLDEQKQTASILKEKIEKVAAAYPDNRQKDLTKALSAYADYGEIPDYLQTNLTVSPKGFFDKLKNGKKIEKANKEFAELMQYCKDNHISDAKKTSGYLYDVVLRGEDISGIFKKINENALSLSEKKDGLQTSIQLSQDKIKTRIDDYDNNPNNIKSRKTENDNIRSFAKEKAPYITNPPTISKEAISTHGLSEDFIEGQIMQSNCPGHVRTSVRRFYEGLDRPAAPMVAFCGVDLPDKVVEDDVLERLKAKGFDAVKATDERAKDPNVFVVTGRSVQAPFMAPDEALKTNIQILETFQESPYVTGYNLSNPLTREALVPAMDKNFGYQQDLGELVKYNGSACDKILSDYYQHMIDNKPYSNLCDLASILKKKDSTLHAKICEEAHKNLTDIKTIKELSFDDYNHIGCNLLQKYEKEFSPHVLDIYLQQMGKEAFDQGISPEILNENLKYLEQNGTLKSVYHGGACSNPYAVLCGAENMCFVYGAGSGSSSQFTHNGKVNHPQGALAYAFGNSSHNARIQQAGGIRYGFLFEYESRGEKQEFIGIDHERPLYDWHGGKFDAARMFGGGDETPILPHQNKLKKIYVVTKGINKKGYQENRILPLELDENGIIKDKKWREFCEIHNPVDDNLKGYMVERRNNMIADYDTTGKEQMMLRHSPIAIQTKSVERSTIHAGTEAAKTSDGVVSALAKADNAFNQAIDKTIDKGSELLNNNAVGRAYEKAAEKVADTKVVKAVEKTTAKAVEKAANTAVGKAVVKTVTKAAGSAVGKSVIKKIPLVSAAAGCYFAWDRIKDGDWKGACGEVASGVAGCFPGLGTAASAAIDVGLAAKDIKTAVDESKQPVAEVALNTGEEKTVSVEQTEDDKKKMRDIILQKQGRLQAEYRPPIQQQAAQQNNFNLQQRAVQQQRY